MERSTFSCELLEYFAMGLVYYITIKFRACDPVMYVE
jgi:hypothetical protein